MALAAYLVAVERGLLSRPEAAERALRVVVDALYWRVAWRWALDGRGALALMIENHRTGLVWAWMGRSSYVRAGLLRAGFDGGWLEAWPTLPGSLGTATPHSPSPTTPIPQEESL